VSEVSGVLVEKYDSLSVTFREKAPPFGKKSAGFAQNALGFDFSSLQPFMPLRDNPFAYVTFWCNLLFMKLLRVINSAPSYHL